MKGATFNIACVFALAMGVVLVKASKNSVVHDDPSQAPAICATPDSSGVLVAHEHCNKYFICTHGSPVAMKCAAQLLYDPKHERCEWPNTVNCGDRVIPNEDDEIKEELVTESSGNGNDDPSQAHAWCAAEGSDNSYVAHEQCNKFYQCWAGQPVPLKCPSGFLWNPKKNYCDFPSNVNCGDRIIPDKEDEVISREEIIPDDEIPIGNNHDDPSQANKICASQDSSGVLVAHEYCNRFYKCTHGRPVSRRCPSGLLFDPTTDRCEWPNTVKCGNRIIPDNDDESNEETVTESIGNGNDDPSQAQALCAAEGSDNSYVAHEQCNKFYQCWAGQPVPLKCPAGFLWNPKKNYCDFPSNVNCGDRIIPDEEDEVISREDVIPDDEIPIGNNHDDPSQANTICASQDSSGVLVAHEYCNRFYKCTHGRPVSQLCPRGLLFDPTRDRCEWPDIVNCGNRIIPDEDDVSEEEKVTESGGNGNDDPSQAAVICAAEGSDNSYVAHEKCDMFYQCWAGEPVPLPCPVGTLWNPKKNYCDFPYNVNCGDRIVPSA